MIAGSEEAWLILRSMAALAFVTALAIVLVRFGLPWLMRNRAGRTQTLSIEEFLPLDRHHALYVIRWRKLRLLVGRSPERLDSLGQIADSDSESTVFELRRAGSPKGTAES